MVDIDICALLLLLYVVDHCINWLVDYGFMMCYIENFNKQ